MMDIAKFRSKSTLLRAGAGMGCAVVIVAALVLAIPREVHAIAAALVQVTNTSANPAVTEDISREASQIVHLTTLGKANVNPAVMTQLHEYIAGGTFGPGYVVPAGQDLVITSIEASVMTAGNNYLNLYDNTTIGQREYWYLPNVGLTQLQFPSGFVYPSGSSVYVYIGGQGNTQMVVDVHGYLTAN
ncbi:MAG TPA: hypothetical protein VGF01_05085 [Terracidiphilus sp.]|jgi:hypothetical protein